MALDGWSVWVLIVFVVAIFLTIRAVYVPIPKATARLGARLFVSLRIIDASEEAAWAESLRRLPLTIETAPPLAVLLLLITTAIDGTTFRLGIVGQEGVKPYNVLILFISLAYIAISLDTTGALRSLAFYFAQRGGKSQSGVRLYTSLYFFFFVFAAIVGNDPVILSGTAFLAYFTRVTGLDPPLPWTLAEFIAANTASAILVPSNPTNVLVSGAFRLNFLTGFTKYTLLPSVIPAIALFPVLLITFKSVYPRSIPPQIISPDVNPRAALIDPAGAIFHSTLMLITLAVLVGTSFVPDEAVSVWMVTLPAGVIAICRDVVTDWVRDKEKRKAKSPVTTPTEGEGPAKLEGVDTPPPIPTQQTFVSFPPSHFPPERQTLSSFVRFLAHRFPITSTTMSRLPIPILPFAMGMFILVQSLLERGWVDVIARGFARACTTPATTTFFIGYMTVILCPFCGTNIGTTILMVEILRTPYFTAKDPQILKAAIYAVALGSNLGAFSVTFTGSLAGLLWKGLLKQKGIIVTPWQFAIFNLVPVVLTTTLACAIILGEIHWF